MTVRSIWAEVKTLGAGAGIIFACLAVLNVAVWFAALAMLRDRPGLLGSVGLAYWLGWRHAFDADHIAAIDNVTRRLVARRRPALATGLFFSLGHSSVVFAVTVGIALTAFHFRTDLLSYRGDLAPAATLVSAGLLLVIGGMNFMTLVRLLRSGRHGDKDLSPTGILSRILVRFTSRIESATAMFPLGVVFGLGFDTATEVGLLGIAATQAVHNLSVWWILVFPALFAAGMALGDTLEGFFMLSMYRWTASCPGRRRGYNIGAVSVSVGIALLVASAEMLGLAPVGWTGRPAVDDAVAFLQLHSEWCGMAVVATFALFWIVGYLADRRIGREMSIGRAIM